MNTNEHILAKCLEVSQPIGDFYCCVINSSDVLEIAFADARRIKNRDIEEIVGVQRELKASRVREIQQYVKNIDAAFPTSIILAIEPENAKFDSKKGEIHIKRGTEIAKIIDGQHRIAGLDGFDGQFDLVVTIFIGMELEDQAMTFATINLAQTKVNKSLVYDLYAYQQARSPTKTCHHIARLLNREKDSPFYHRIKILGTATGESLEFITQAAFVSRLQTYLTDDPMRDRDALKREKALPEPPRSKVEGLIFRDLFAGKKDEVIADVVWTYFDAVASRWSRAWQAEERGMILNRTQGFAGLMRFLAPVYQHYCKKDKSVDFDEVLTRFKKIKLKDEDFSTDRFPPGTSGESQLFKTLLEESGLS